MTKRSLFILSVLLLAALGAAEIPHEDPALLFRSGDTNKDNVMDARELEEFYKHKEDTFNGKAIADLAGGAKKATQLMDTSRDGKLSADEFLAYVTPRYHKAIAEEDFAAADANGNGSLDLEEYKSSNYGMERVPDFVHEGFEDHFKQLDTNQDNSLTKEEYLEAAGLDSFAIMDTDHDGIVTLAEFRKHKHSHYHSGDNEPVTPESDNSQAAFDELDTNKDGKLTRSEEAFAMMPDQDEVLEALRSKEGDHTDGNDDNDIGAED